MAVETITLNAGSGGAAVAVDTVSGASYQLVKIAAGGDGVAGFAATNYYYRSAGATNQDSQAVKANPGVVYDFQITNTNASARYFKLYDGGSPTSASTPVGVFAVPGSGGIAISFPHGRSFPTAIGFRLTTGSADNDANAVAAGEVMVNVGYA